MITLMAGLQTVPDQLLRAAQVDGANTWNRFWHVTFPHPRGASTVTILLLAGADVNEDLLKKQSFKFWEAPHLRRLDGSVTNW